VAVIGGGNSAIDSARSALRLGAKEVTVVYRRSRTEMPAHNEEIEDAIKEGVKFRFLAAPIAVHPAHKAGEKCGDSNSRVMCGVKCDNKITSLECIAMELGQADKSGRRKPVPVKDSEFTIDADVIITAISQAPDLEFIGNTLELTNWGGLKVNPITMETSLKGVFAGGDTITQSGMVIFAIATGQKSAGAIDKYLGGPGRLPENIDTLLAHTTDLKGPHEPLKADRQPIPHIPVSSRKHNLREVICGYSDSVAYKEASRCLRCDLENKEYK